MALESSGIDINSTKKLIQGLIDNAQIKLEKAIKDEYDKKIKEINNNLSKMTAKIQPVQDLTANGKPLPVAILEYIMSSDGIASIIEKSRNDIMQSEEMMMKFVTYDKLQRTLNETSENFSEINIQISEFETNRKQFMYDVGNLKNTFSEYVHHKQLEKTLEELNNKLEGFAPWDSVRGVYKEFYGYVKTGEFQTYQQELEEKFEQTDEQMKLRLTIEGGDSIKGWTEQLVERKLADYSEKGDCALDKKELQYTIDKFVREFADSKKFFDRVDSEFNALRHLLTTKATIKQVNDIRGDMDVLATKDDYKRIKELMTEFEGSIGRYRQEATIHSEILRRYDEVISEKASKFNLLELEGKIKMQAGRIDTFSVVEKRLDTIGARVEKQRKDNEARFDIINQSISIEIMNAVKKAVRQSNAAARATRKHHPENGHGSNTGTHEGNAAGDQTNTRQAFIIGPGGGGGSGSHNVTNVHFSGDIAYLISQKAT